MGYVAPYVGFTQCGNHRVHVGMGEMRIERGLVIPHLEDNGPIRCSNIDGPVIDLCTGFFARVFLSHSL